MATPPVSTPPRPADLDLVLRTPRLLLRPIAESDVDAIWPYVSDPELPRMMSWAYHRDPAETAEHLRGNVQALADGRDAVWAIVVDGRASGAIGLHALKYQVRALRYDCAELGYWVAPPLWGHGLCTEAARAVVAFGFGPLCLHKITVCCFEENPASRRVIEKVGFRLVGVRREHCFRDGRWMDQRDYELTGDEWAAAASA